MTMRAMRRTEAGKWWALAGLNLGVLAVGLDATVLGVALPTLAGSLRASASDLQWFVSAYTLALAVALLPGGLAGDRFGRKKVMLGVLGLFGLGSLACAFSPDPGLFIAARVVQGLSAGAMVPLVLSVLAVMFTDEERPKAVGVWAAANFLSLPVGPILGGWLLSRYWWGWVFLLNLPVVVIGLAAVALLVPESRAPERPGLDVAGIAAASGGLALLVYGFITAGQDGWSSPGAIAAMTAGAAALTGFAAWEARLGRRPGGQPLVDPGLFSSARFTWGTILQAFGIFAMFGLLFALPQFFQAVLGVNAMGSGVRLLPLMAGLAIGAPLADQAARRISAKLTASLGFAILAGALAAGAATRAASSEAFLAAWTGVAGLGFGLALATAATAALVDLPKDRAGIGSAVMQAAQKTGAPLSAAILGSVLSTGYLSRLHLSGLPAAAAAAVRGGVFGGIRAARAVGSEPLLHQVQSAFTHGMSGLLQVSAGLAVAGAVLALVFLPWRATAAPGGAAVAAAASPGEESCHERAA